MMFRFCKWLLPSLLLAAAPLFAQAPTPATPTPEPKAKKPKNGSIRFWNVLPKDQGDLVLIKENGTPEGEALLYADPGNFYASYVPVPPARYSLKVVRRNEPTTALQTFDVLMRGDVYITFIGQMVEGKIKVEMLDDTFDPTTAVAGRLTIRQHFPGIRVVVAATPQMKSRSLSEGETEVLDGLPLKPLEVNMSAVLADGKTQQWSTDVNFKSFRHASLLIIPDPYGRFRPRVTVDGNPVGSQPAN
jgi:hypothetical protein